MEWKIRTESPEESVQVVIIPKETKNLMSKTTCREVYLWSKHHKIVKRLPRKIKKRLYYGSRSKSFVKAGVILIRMWNEYENNRGMD